MIDGSEKRNRQLPFVFEKCCKWPQRWVKTVTAMKESTDTVVNYRWGRGLCEMRDFEIQTRDMCLPPPPLPQGDLSNVWSKSNHFVIA